MNSDYNIPSDKSLKKAAKKLKNDCEVKNRLWNDFLRDYSVQFFRNQVIAEYIADFCCPEAKLVVELEGSDKADKDNLLLDTRRTDCLETYGFKVLSFLKNDVEENFDKVCSVIDNEVKARIIFS